MILNRTKSILITLLALLQLGSANIFAGNSAVPSATDDKVVIPAPGEKTLLHSGWLARRANEVLVDGNTLTMQSLNTEGWLKARVPGTVLGTLLDNKLYPAPEFGLNNNLIPDIYHTGNDFYTYLKRTVFLKTVRYGSISAVSIIWRIFISMASV